MKTWIGTIMLIAGVVSFKAKACECGVEAIVGNAIKAADVVFVGKVLSKDLFLYVDSSFYPRYPNSLSAGRSSLSRYKILIKNIYKGGTVGDTLTIYTGNGGGDCGWPFKEGKTYIIYGIETPSVKKGENPLPHGKNIFWTSICQRTRAFNKSEIVEIEKITLNKRR